MGRPKKGEEKDRAGRVSFRIPVQIDKTLRAIAKARKAPVSDVVVEALEVYTLAGTRTWVWDGVRHLAEESSQPAGEVVHELLDESLRRHGIKPPARTR